MPNVKTIIGFHGQSAKKLLFKYYTSHQEPKFTYTFENYFHPYVGELIQRLNKGTLADLLDATWQASLRDETFFKQYYTTDPEQKGLVEVESAAKEIDVSTGGPYANYNWELFFHIPLAIATHLSKSQRFAEAQRWFHYIFDPTASDTSIPSPKRFWKFLRFRGEDLGNTIDEVIALLSKPATALSPADKARQDEQLQNYYALLNNPFHPHVVARSRPISYEYNVVMKYLDNLIAWGDSLFQQYTVETINEATQLYVLAANLLGARPQRIPPRGAVRPKTFADLKKDGLGPIGDAFVELEGHFPFNLAPAGISANDDGSTQALFGIGRSLYFCVPGNDKMLGYWDTVQDRLFKIRHCMDIEGVVRPLALFDPPIDPGMLVKAAAAGLDIGSIVSGLNQPLGPLRCLTMIQKALELCGEVRSLGSSLLSALEKGDGEQLSLIRQRHEIQIQQMTQEVRFLQWKSAQESTKSLLTSRVTALERFQYYQRLLGLPADANAPATLTISETELTEDNFDEAYGALVDQYDKAIGLQKYSQLKLAGASSPSTQSGGSGTGQLYLNTNEDADLNKHGPEARNFRLAGVAGDTVAGPLSMIPDVGVDFHWWGLGGHTIVFGGTMLANSARFASAILNMHATDEEGQGAQASKTAGFQRRADEWLLQYNLAAHELMQIGRQILTSKIGEQIAHHEYVNIQQQIANANEVNDFLQSKFTNADLYLWMQGEISRLYYNYYKFAFDTARRAEQTMKRELMRPVLDAQDFVKFNYWDGGRKGLLSGEALHLDVKKMELAYHDSNKRELELTRHVSLRQLNPVALLALKISGICQLEVPEWVYDMDCPGHYLRRIKSVALTIPCVTGPYTGVNCTLTLLKSSVRKSSLLKDGEYPRQGTDDDRFIDYSGAAQSVVTSSGQNDSGLFETNLRDERFLPFEGYGAWSIWQLQLPDPTAYPAFDYSTITDVILHIRYTARQGIAGENVKNALDELFGKAGGAGLAMLLSLRHDFPTEWAKFTKQGSTDDFAATIARSYFPYFAQNHSISLDAMELYDGSDATSHKALDLADQNKTDLNDKQKQGFTVSTTSDSLLTRDPNAEFFLVIKYSLTKSGQA